MIRRLSSKMQNISFQLKAAFFSIFFLLAVQGLFALYFSQHIARSQREAFAKVGDLLEFSNNLSHARIDMFKVLGTVKSENITTWRKEIEALFGKLYTASERLDIHPLLLNRIQDTCWEIIDLQWNFKTKKAYDLMNARSEKEYEALSNNLQTMIREIKAEKDRTIAKTDRLFICLSIVICLSGMLIVLGIGFYATKGVLRQVGGEPAKIMEIAKRIADGDLSINFTTEGKQIYGIYAAMRTMTFRLKGLIQELQVSERKYRSIFENAVEGIFQMLPGGRFISANKSMSTLLGYGSPEELMTAVPDGFNRIFANTEDLKSFTDSILNTGEINGFETNFFQKSGEIIQVLINTHLVYSDDLQNPSYFEGRVMDISAKKQMEEYKIAKEVAEAANKAKSEFLANMSHEIRTPLNAVIGFSELLTTLVTDDHQKSHLNAIKTSGNILLSMVNDILDLSKIEAGRIEIRAMPVNLRAILSEIAEIFKMKIAEKKLNFLIEIDENLPEALLLDEARLRQILINLVGNAVKFTDNGYVRIIVESISEPGNPGKVNLVISVSDTGIGISAEEQDKIFTAFEQQSGQSLEKYGGTGLGLAITQKLTELMNGQIRVSSEKGQGSVFKVLFSDVPVSLTMALSVENKCVITENLLFKKARILVVDDIESNRSMLSEVLSSVNLDVIHAKNGQEAIDLIQKTLPDLVIMDIRMPVMDGVDAVGRLKQNPRTKQIPVIAVTAASTLSEKDGFLEKGFDGYLTKPVKIANLLGELSRFLFCHKEEQKPLEKDHPLPGLQIETVQRPSDLIDTLKGQISESLQAFKNGIIMSNLMDFGCQVQKLGQDHNVRLLDDLGRELNHYARIFDIGAIKQRLSEFPELADQLIHRLEKAHEK